MTMKSDPRMGYHNGKVDASLEGLAEGMRALFAKMDHQVDVCRECHRIVGWLRGAIFVYGALILLLTGSIVTISLYLLRGRIL